MDVVFMIDYMLKEIQQSSYSTELLKQYRHLLPEGILEIRSFFGQKWKISCCLEADSSFLQSDNGRADLKHLEKLWLLASDTPRAIVF